MSFQPLEHGKFLTGALVHPRGAPHLGHAPFQHFHVRKDQFQIDGLDITQRIYTAVHMHHIGILKTAHHMYNRIHLADIAQELIAQSLTLGSTFHQSRNIYELNHCRRHLLGVIHITQQLQPLIRHRHHAHVGVNGTERIIGGFRARLCQ